MVPERLEDGMSIAPVMADTSWPDAAVAIAGVALVTAVVVVLIWQALATWRARMEVSREEAYRRLAEQTAADLREIRRQLGLDEGASS
jgi:hypothetical protein